jgi:hypothetical protein
LLGKEVLELLHDGVGLVLLVVAENGGDDNDSGKDDTDVHVLGGVGVKDVSDEREGRTDFEKDREPAEELVQELLPFGLSWGRGKGVVSVANQTVANFAFSETLFDISAKARDKLLLGDLVLIHLNFLLEIFFALTVIMAVSVSVTVASHAGHGNILFEESVARVILVAHPTL